MSTRWHVGKASDGVTRAPAGIDGAGWEAQIRARHQDRAYRATQGLDIIRIGVAQSRGSRRSHGASGLSAGARPAPDTTRRRRMLRAALLFLAACALVASLPPPWDLVLALGLLAVALMWATLGLHRMMPLEGQGRTDR